MLSKTYTKYIQSLHHKKGRGTENAFTAEGSKVVMDLLRSPKIVCLHLLALSDWLNDNESVIRRYFNGPIEKIEPHELQKISSLTTPSEVLAIFNKADARAVDPHNNITIMLDTIQDPGNLGTIIRIADWFAIPAIVCSEGCADMYNPKVVQSTMGSLGRVEVVYTDLTQWINKHTGIPLYAAALNGMSIEGIKRIKEGIIIIGNESKGIGEAVLQLATERITIPKRGYAESLNAAVATGIILSHLVLPPASPGRE